MDIERSVVNPDRNDMLSIIGFDRNIVSACDHYLIDDRAEHYLDFSAQFGVMSFGHNHTEITAILTAHINERAPIMIQPFHTKYVDMLGEKLLGLLPEGAYQHVAFCSSGSEAVEAAIKLARSKTGRKCILSAHNSFHGKTEGALCATGNPTYQLPFMVDLKNNSYVKYGDADNLEQALKTQKFAAFIIEPIQGEGGMVTPPEGYLKSASALCQRYRTLLIVDEIQTGLGRTGKVFACEYSNISPDMILLAKSLSGGVMPIGAVIVKQGVWNNDFGSYHSSTFANNNLAARIGLKILEILTNNDGDLLRQVQSKGQYLKNKLTRLTKKFPDVFESTDGIGLMQGLKLRPWSGDRLYMMSFASSCGYSVPIVTGFLINQYNIVCLPTLNSKRVLRIQPPLTVSTKEIDQLCHALDEIGGILSNQLHDIMIDAIAKRRRVNLPRFREHPKTASSPILQKDEKRYLGNFAFFIHPVSMCALNGDIALGNGRFSPERRKALEDWITDVVTKTKEQLEVGIAYHATKIYSANGGYVNGYLISCLLTPTEMLKLSLKKRNRLFESYFNCLEGLNVDYVGLGAYTSIISQSGSDLVNRGYSITTGNSLTSIACRRSMIEYSDRSGKPISSRVVGIIGANGSVGRLAALDIALRCKAIKLIGNPKNKNARYELANIAGEIIFHLLFNRNYHNSPLRHCLRKADGYQDHEWSDLKKRNENCYRDLYFRYEALAEAPDKLAIEISTDVAACMAGADAVISATSQGGGFIDIDICKPGTIICDAAQPPDLHMTNHPSDQVFAYSGGVMTMPDKNYRFGEQNVTGLGVGKVLACLTETIALTMSDEMEHQSIGRHCSIEKAVDIYDLALSHGFALDQDDQFCKVERKQPLETVV